MNIKKNLVELMGYAKIIGDFNIVPVKIDADDLNCRVEFLVYTVDKKQRKYIRKGKHIDYIFATSVDNVPFTINLKTGVIKKVRS